MKTRKRSLPLVILIALVLGTSVSAQTVAHSPLFAYLDKLPNPPAFPDDHALMSTPPEHFEEHSELNALESNLETIINGVKTNPERISKTDLVVAQTSPGTENIPSESIVNIRQLSDVMLETLKDMQSVKTEFQENFQRLENTFSKNLDKVYDASRTLQKEQPCGTNTACQTEHFRLLNSGIVAATREKVKNEEYLLSVYLTRVKPSFRSLDQMLAGNAYGDGIKNVEVKKLIQSVQHDQFLLLTDLIERIKLERITISNCARLAQQYQK